MSSLADSVTWENERHHLMVNSCKAVSSAVDLHLRASDLTSACGYGLADPTSNKTCEYFPPSHSCPPIFTMLAFIWYIVFGKILLFSSNRLARFELFLNSFFQSCFSSLLSPSQCCLSVFKFRKLNKDWLRLEGKASLSDLVIFCGLVTIFTCCPADQRFEQSEVLNYR